MKNLTAYKLKPIAKKVSIFALTLLMIASCGSDNKTSSSNTNSTGTSPIGSGNPILIDPGTPQHATWSNLKGQITCPMGRAADMAFIANPNTGELTQGQVAGTSQSTYFGKSTHGDLMFIDRLTDSTGQTAYNIVLSYCVYQDSYAQYIGPNAGMTNFVAHGISLGPDKGCPSRNITTGNVQFISPNFDTYVPYNIHYQPITLGNECF